MTYYLPRVEALRAAYETGALVDAVVTDRDGTLTVAWPNGRGLCAVDPEVIERLAGELNRLRSPAAQALEAASQKDDQQLWVAADEMIQTDLEAAYLAADRMARVLGQVLNAKAERDRRRSSDGWCDDCDGTDGHHFPWCERDA